MTAQSREHLLSPCLQVKYPETKQDVNYRTLPNLSALIDKAIC